MPVRDFFTGLKHFNNYDGEFGIEIETETKTPYDYPNFFFWAIHQDGSLRNFGVEYVLKQPIKYELLPEALEEFKDKTSKIKFIKDSFSTSVHVHVNMLNESAVTLGNFITTYTLFENLLIRYSGPNRLSNLFCLPMIDAEETYQYAVQMMKGMEQKNYRSLIVNENVSKYAALNLSALGKYGSLEIRSFRGETDVPTIKTWVDIIYCILKYARKMENPKAILEEYRNRGVKLKDDVFKDFSSHLDHKDQEKLIESNVFFAASIAYAVRDWGSLEKKQVGKFNPTQKDKERYAKALFGVGFNEIGSGEQHFILLRMEEDHNKGTLNPQKTRTKKPEALQAAWANLVPELNPGLAAGQVINPNVLNINEAPEAPEDF